VHLVGRIGDLAEALPRRLLLVDLARLGAGGEHVVVGPSHDARRYRSEEEQLVLDDRSAERPAELALVVRLLGVLVIADGGEVVGIEHQALERRRAQAAADVVVVRLAAEAVAARLGDRAHHAAERAAEFGVDAAGLHLHFLQVLEHRVLARVAVDQAVDRDAVHRERILGGARPVHLEAALDLTGVDAGRRQGEALEAARLRQPVEFFGRDVVGQRHLRHVELLGRISGDVHRLRHAADL
jgi:hypothetical protein